jgi:hypothetical protein
MVELCPRTALMAVQAFLNLIQPGELWGVAALVIIGVALTLLVPAKSVERVSAAVALAPTPGKIPTPTSPSLKEAKAEYAKLQ